MNSSYFEQLIFVAECAGMTHFIRGGAVLQSAYSLEAGAIQRAYEQMGAATVPLKLSEAEVQANATLYSPVTLTGLEVWGQGVLRFLHDHPQRQQAAWAEWFDGFTASGQIPPQFVVICDLYDERYYFGPDGKLMFSHLCHDETEAVVRRSFQQQGKVLLILTDAAATLEDHLCAVNDSEYECLGFEDTQEVAEAFFANGAAAQTIRGLLLTLKLNRGRLSAA